MSHISTTVNALVLIGALAATVDAQTITRVIPEAANQGDFIIIEGTNLQSTTTVDFTADTGGFAGQRTVREAPLAVSSTLVLAQVTNSFGFAPPNATPPGSPNGSLALSDSNGRTSNPVKFFYMRGTFVPPSYAAQQVTTLGNGTTQSAVPGRSVVDFPLGSGAPTPGNASFVMGLGNATPGPATLLVGLPGVGPFFMFGDGTFVLDLANPIVSVPGTVVAPNGTATLPFPIPAGPFGVTLANQWAQLDFGLPGGIAVSNGLVYTI